MPARFPFLGLAVVFVVGCPISRPGSADDGGGMDGTVTAIDAADATRIDTGSAPDLGGECTDEGQYYCDGMGHQCCGGHWISYWDGPCWGAPDGSVSDCAVDPTAAGCACASDGAVACRSFQPRNRCVGGVWTIDYGHACC